MTGLKNVKPGSLDGVTVIDFTLVLSEPNCSKLLADMGAKVIKIEPYTVGTKERHLNIQKNHDRFTQSNYSINENRGIKSVCINLKTPQGLEIIKELIKQADVVLENYAPGVMERLGLDYESVKKIKDNIIYCSISCFGHMGPYSHKHDYEMIAQVASGWTAQSEVYQIAPNAIGDTVAGAQAAFAIVSALYARNVQGVGQNIDVAMVESLFSLHEN